MKFLSLLAVLALNSIDSFAQDFPVVAGCKASDYVTAQEPITINVTRSFSFSPHCLKIQRGSSVTIDGSFIHPVQGMPSIGGVVNPIFNAKGPSTVPMVVSFEQPGLYGYFCMNHGDANGNGMAASILVE